MRWPIFGLTLASAVILVTTLGCSEQSGETASSPTPAVIGEAPPAVEPTQAPAAPPTAEPTPPPAPPPAQGNCDPSYPTVCIPPAPPNLNCGDITFRRFTVLPPDPHGFDGNDNDGLGCES